MCSVNTGPIGSLPLIGKCPACLLNEQEVIAALIAPKNPFVIDETLPAFQQKTLSSSAVRRFLEEATTNRGGSSLGAKTRNLIGTS